MKNIISITAILVATILAASPVLASNEHAMSATRSTVTATMIKDPPKNSTHAGSKGSTEEKDTCYYHYTLAPQKQIRC